MPLVGTQGATLLIENGQDDVVDGVALILTPGENYFMQKDYKSSQTLFMGDDARLQNEIQIEAPHMQNDTLFLQERQRNRSLINQSVTH